MRRAMSLGLSLTLFIMAACGDDSAPADASVDAVPADASPPVMGLVGSACAVDRDCLAGLSCFTGPAGARPWPEGYCTRDCSSADDCLGGSVCGLAYGAVDGTFRNMCLLRCSRERAARGACREGYTCGWQGFCVVGCGSDEQCRVDDTWPGPALDRPDASCEISSGRCRSGTAGGRPDGAACASNADCAAPSGRCLLGECHSSDCDLAGADGCPAGEECVGLDIGFDSWANVCLTSCRAGLDGRDGAAADERCGSGFDCRPAGADPAGRATMPFCDPTGTPYGTSGGATMGDACVTASDCPAALGYAECVSGICSAFYCAAPELAGQDLCGPGARCITPTEVDRATEGFVVSQVGLGVCLRDCSTDASVCAGASVCQAGSCTVPAAL